MVATRQGQGRPRHGRVTAMAFVGIALFVGCADASNDAAGTVVEEPLGVVPPDDGADGEAPDDPDDGAADDGVDDGGAPDDPDPAPDPAVLSAAAIELFEATEDICADHADAVGNTPIDPEHFDGAEVVDVRPGDPDLVVIRDGVGVELFVALDRDEVWGGPEPDAIMPAPYSFGCPPEVYVGTLDH